MTDFENQPIGSWWEFAEVVRELPGEWAYRGQSEDWPLATSLERGLINWGLDLSIGPEVERQVVREFKRQYRGDDLELVNKDTLYCFALMQHHGAPTRLLDWTYSPFVAAKFAIGTGAKEPVIWCIKNSWCAEAAKQFAGESVVAKRKDDTSRDDSSFLPLYIKPIPPMKFVFPENPLCLNQRLIIQQGLFMCPGDTGATFVDNLKAMDGWDSRENVIKLCFTSNRQEQAIAAAGLHWMNVDSAVLFPDLGGFARSLCERLPLFADFARRNIGKPEHEVG